MIDVIRNKLQFGHDFSAVETFKSWLSQKQSNPASIRPRLFSRGNDDNETDDGGSDWASIRPRLFSRGNQKEND